MNSAGTNKQRGISLIELIMFIVVVSIALAGIMLVMDQVTGHSADALLRKQAQVVAESLLEEIDAQNFANISQANIDVLANNLNALHGLTGYSVSAVLDSGTWSNIPAASAAKITVTVSDPLGKTVALTGYRTNY